MQAALSFAIRWGPEYPETFPELVGCESTPSTATASSVDDAVLPEQKASMLMPYRYNPDLQSSPTVLGNKTRPGGWASHTDINDSSDVVIICGSTVSFSITTRRECSIWTT